MVRRSVRFEARRRYRGNSRAHGRPLFPETWRGAVELAEEGVSDTRTRLECNRDRAAVKVNRARAVSDVLRHALAMAKKAVQAPMPPQEVNRP